MIRVIGFEKPGVNGFDVVANQIIILDANDTPIALYLQHGDIVLRSVAGDPDFPDACRQAGYVVRTPEIGRR